MGLCPCFGRKRSCSSKTTMNRGLETDADCNSDCQEEAALAFSLTHSSYPLPPPPVEPFFCMHTPVEPNKLKCALSLDSSNPENFAPTFTYRELAAATNNFRRECCIGEGGFGSVYKGLIPSTGQVVAVKKLDPLGVQGTKEFIVEVLMLSLLRHPNLINLVGFCAEGDQRLLVYEFLPLGSLEDHLHDLGPEMNPLDWNTRMKIAVGVAEGLDYLHNQADPPVIHRDLKSSNILLGKGFHPKLSDFGLAKFGPPEDKSHVSTRVMGTEGYCAPEYFDTGKLTAKSDIYCFGIVLLEIITGRRAKDETRENGRRNLHEWARPLLKDQSNYVQMVDERMEGRFPHSGLQLAMQVAIMCLRDVPTSRPSMNEVVTAMKFVLGKRVEPAGRDGWVRGSRENGEHDSITTDLIGAEDAGGGAATVEAARSSKKEEERERERAVAEAKLWGETCRAKMQLCAKGEFDNSNL